jgi:hypothetical protein
VASASIDSQFDLKGIISVLKEISAYRNQDKNSLCKGLAATDTLIGLWYNRINEHFNGAKWEDKDEYSKLKKYIFQRDIQPEAWKCYNYLTHVREQYVKGKLQKNLQSELNMQLLNDVIRNISSFIDTTDANDTIIYSKIASDRPVPEEEIQNFIIEMLTGLDRFRHNVNTQSTKLIFELCKGFQ